MVVPALDNNRNTDTAHLEVLCHCQVPGDKAGSIIVSSGGLQLLPICSMQKLLAKSQNGRWRDESPLTCVRSTHFTEWLPRKKIGRFSILFVKTQLPLLNGPNGPIFLPSH